MGAYIAWKENYSVGDNTIDNQHKQILAMISDLHTAIEGGREQSAIKAILDRIVLYTMSHFNHEEHVMQACGYPDFANHKEQHDQMRRTTEGFRTNLQVITGRDVLRLLKSWWTSHIQAEDQCYVPYLRAATSHSKMPGAPIQPANPVNWGGQTPTYR
jgi:hemerythrin